MKVVREETSWPVTVVWAVVSVAVAVTSVVCFVQPTWFVREEKRLGRKADVFSLGVFSFCYRVDNKEELHCEMFRGLFDSGHYPSEAWQVSCVLYGTGCVLMCCCALAAILGTFLLTPLGRKTAAQAIGVTQAVAVMALAVSLLVFPFGLNSPFVHKYCGPSSGVYMAGSCLMGWGYTLAAVTTLIGIYCPIFARFTSYTKYHRADWTYWANV